MLILNRVELLILMFLVRLHKFFFQAMCHFVNELRFRVRRLHLLLGLLLFVEVKGLYVELLCWFVVQSILKISSVEIFCTLPQSKHPFLLVSEYSIDLFENDQHYTYDLLRINQIPNRRYLRTHKTWPYHNTDILNVHLIGTLLRNHFFH